MPQQKGFSLIELLVVIAIVALLSSIIITNIASARGQAVATQSAEIAHQYDLAIFQYMGDFGRPPSIPVLTKICLGSPTAQCLSHGTAYTGNDTFNQQLASYVSTMPEAQTGVITISGSTYQGMIYTCSSVGACSFGTLSWPQTGIHCIFGVTMSDGTNSLCVQSYTGP